MAVSSNTILGKYRIVREIARSNDIVYEALDPAMSRRVAVKELQLPPHLAGAQKRERIERFYREAKAAGTLSHRNIVTIHEVGQENDRHFLVMEYLEGQSLRDILQMQGALPTKETVEIALQLCDALGYAHSRGVVHRDVKPDNVHILPGGVIKLTDFGIARITAEPSITSQGQVFGTPSYMSPEQVASHSVDHRTDLFSLGITLYEMLAGRKPFVGDSVITITYNIMNIQPAMPAGLSPGMHAILQRALAKDPNMRYQNAAAFAADLRAEKFALTSPQAAQGAGLGKTSALTFQAAPGAPLTLDAPTPDSDDFGYGGPDPVETTISYNDEPQRATASRRIPARPAPNTAVDDAAGRRSNRRNANSGALSFALSVIGLLALLALVLWGISKAFHAYQSRNRRVAATQLYQNANQAFVSGNYAAATNGYQAALSTAPPDTEEAAQARVGLSKTATVQGLKDEQAHDATGATASYEKAVALDAQNAAALTNLGNLRWQQGDQTGALDAWQSAAKADPMGESGKQARQSASQRGMDLARQARDAGNLPAARVLWQKVIDVDPGSPEAFEAQNSLNNSQPPSTASL